MPSWQISLPSHEQVYTRKICQRLHRHCLIETSVMCYRRYLECCFSNASVNSTTRVSENGSYVGNWDSIGSLCHERIHACLEQATSIAPEVLHGPIQNALAALDDPHTAVRLTFPLDLPYILRGECRSREQIGSYGRIFCTELPTLWFVFDALEPGGFARGQSCVEDDAYLSVSSLCQTAASSWATCPLSSWTGHGGWRRMACIVLQT